MNDEEHRKVLASNKLFPSTTKYECKNGFPAYEANTVVFVFDSAKVNLNTVRSMAESYCDDAIYSWIVLFRMNLQFEEDHSQDGWEGSCVHSGPIDLASAIETRWMEFRK
jgi:hypothetical protein